MSVILHLSDLHVHEDPDHRNNRKVAAIVRWTIEHYADQPLIVIITGDLVDDGTEGQYLQLLGLLRPLKAAGFRLLVAPGNHDCGPMGNSYLASSRVYFQMHVVGELMGISVANTATDVMAGLFPMVHRIDGVTYVGLDSVAGMVFAGMHFARGAIGDDQLAKLRRILDFEAGQQPLVVYLHHHPFDRHYTLCLRDSDELMATLGERYNLLLFGHKHRSETWPGGGSPLTASRIAVAAGKTTHADAQHRCEVREACLVAGNFTVTRQQIRV